MGTGSHSRVFSMEAGSSPVMGLILSAQPSTHHREQVDTQEKGFVRTTRVTSSRASKRRFRLESASTRCDRFERSSQKERRVKIIAP